MCDRNMFFCILAWVPHREEKSSRRVERILSQKGVLCGRGVHEFDEEPDVHMETNTYGVVASGTCHEG